MPRVKRRAKRRRGQGWSEDHIHHLLRGHAFSVDAGFGSRENGTLDEDRLRLAWEELRNPLLGDWIPEHPGTRPYAWWLCDAPEPRRVVSGIEHPMSGFRNMNGDGPREHWYGIPNPVHVLRRDECVDKGLEFPQLPPKYESEVSYLGRLGLLTVAERDVLELNEHETDN